MIRLVICIIPLVVFFSSCKKEQTKMPIPAEKLEAVLNDIHIADAAMQYVSDEKLDSLKKVYYKQVFEIHKVEEAAFFECMEILALEPKLGSKIYQNILDSLDSNKKKISTEKIPTKKREWSRDSLSRE